MIAPPVPQGASLPPASFQAVRPRLFASRMKSERHLASPSTPIASSCARIAWFAAVLAGAVELAGRVAVRVEHDAGRARPEPERGERGLVHARPGEAAALDPERVCRSRGAELGEREEGGVVELWEAPPTLGRPDPLPVGQLDGLGRVHGECRGAAGDEVEPDDLRPAVVALAHSVEMAVDETWEHAPALEVDDLRARVGESLDAAVLIVGGDDLAVPNRDRLHRRVRAVERRDDAVVEDQVGGVRDPNLLVDCRSRGVDGRGDHERHERQADHRPATDQAFHFHSSPPSARTGKSQM